jgi:hypothetical protein
LLKRSLDAAPVRNGPLGSLDFSKPLLIMPRTGLCRVEVVRATTMQVGCAA